MTKRQVRRRIETIRRLESEERERIRRIEETARRISERTKVEARS